MPAPERIDQALDLLGIRNLLLGIHDAAFPSLADEDVGRGSPYSAGAADFLSFVRELGFRGVQLGPQGATSPGNTSPYDATLFSRNPLSLALGPLTRPEWAELLPADELARLVASRPGSRERVPHGWIHTAIAPVCTSVWDRFRSAWVEGSTKGLPELAVELEAFSRANGGWLSRDGLYEALAGRERRTVLAGVVGRGRPAALPSGPGSRGRNRRDAAHASGRPHRYHRGVGLRAVPSPQAAP